MGKTRDKLAEIKSLLISLRNAGYDLGRIPIHKLEMDEETQTIARRVSAELREDLAYVRSSLQAYFLESSLRHHYRERYYVTELDPESTLTLGEVINAHGNLSGPWSDMMNAEGDLKRKMEYEAKKRASTSPLRGKPKTYAIVGYNPQSNEWRKIEPTTQSDRRTA